VDFLVEKKVQGHGFSPSYRQAPSGSQWG